MELVEAPPAREAFGGVAVVTVDGPLAQRAREDLCGYLDGYDAIAARCVVALDDGNVSALVLRVNSPGGDVAGLEQAIGRIVAARARTGKPIYGFIDETAASAGYWLIGAVADAGIYAPASALVGCLGVLGVAIDRSAQLAAQGVKLVVAAQPSGKADHAPGAPLSDAIAKQMAERVGETWARMVASISGARPKLTPKALEDLDAATVGAERAVKVGLIDALASNVEAVIEIAAGEAARRSSMEKIRAALGLGAEAPEGDVVQAIEARAASARLGEAVLAETKTKTAEEALGVVKAWGTSHASAETERASREAEMRAAEVKERRELVARKVAAGFEMPAQAWADSDGKVPSKKYEAMSLEVLRAEVAVYERQPRAIVGGGPLAPAKADSSVVTDSDEELAARTGVDPKTLATARAGIVWR